MSQPLHPNSPTVSIPFEAPNPGSFVFSRDNLSCCRLHLRPVRVRLCLPLDLPLLLRLPRHLSRHHQLPLAPVSCLHFPSSLSVRCRSPARACALVSELPSPPPPPPFAHRPVHLDHPLPLRPRRVVILVALRLNSFGLTFDLTFHLPASTSTSTSFLSLPQRTRV